MVDIPSENHSAPDSADAPRSAPVAGPAATSSPERGLDLSQAELLVRVRSAGASELAVLLQGADQDLIRCALKNPQLNDTHLLGLLKRPGLPEGAIRAIHRSPQAARSRRVKIALAGHHATPPPVLQDILGQLFLFELVAVLRLPGASPDHKAAAQQAILKRLPETELGAKITLARQGSPAILEALMCEGERRLVEAALGNPALREPNLLAFLRSAAATAETISAALRHPRWGGRLKVRLAALKNRNTPAVWFTLFLPSLATAQLRELAALQGTGSRQAQALQEELQRRGAAPSRISD